MKFFNWFKTLWHRDAVAKAIQTAQLLVQGLSTDQFQIIVDKVTTQTGGKCVWDANASTDSRIKITRSTGTVRILDDDTPE